MSTILKKTKFILHGGFPSRPNEANFNFFREILQDTPREVRVLLVYFAKEKEEHERCSNENKSLFNKNSGDKKLLFEIAQEEVFLEQVARADVIYLSGGKTSKLLHKLKKFPEFKEMLKNKTVVGDSAGAYVLSSCFYSKTEGGVFKGLELVPVRTICHYIGINEEKLDKYLPQLERLLLSDHQYKVFHI